MSQACAVLTLQGVSSVTRVVGIARDRAASLRPLAVSRSRRKLPPQAAGGHAIAGERPPVSDGWLAGMETTPSPGRSLWCPLRCPLTGLVTEEDPPTASP